MSKNAKIIIEGIFWLAFIAAWIPFVIWMSML